MNQTPQNTGAPICNPPDRRGMQSGALTVEGMPLAMVYVPVQEFDRLYEPAEALRHASLFVDLYKPITTACPGGMR